MLVQFAENYHIHNFCMLSKIYTPQKIIFAGFIIIIYTPQKIAATHIHSKRFLSQYSDLVISSVG